jgi:deoxyribodipyrimidine photo-lyase
LLVERTDLARPFISRFSGTFPHVVGHSFKADYGQSGISQRPRALRRLVPKRVPAIPIVDAAMHQLNHSGYMHNRLRMIVASFLVKDLLIDWRWGEAYFAEKLLDFDLSANNGGWQWAASTGCDAQPYFRIFNPITQSEKIRPQKAASFVVICRNWPGCRIVICMHRGLLPPLVAAAT